MEVSTKKLSESIPGDLSPLHADFPEDVEHVKPQSASFSNTQNTPQKNKKTTGTIKKKKRKNTTLKEVVDYIKDNNLQSSIPESFSIEMYENPPTPIPKNVSREEQILWLQKKRNVGLWAYCDMPGCNKIRWLEHVKDPTELPEKWFCYMNPDKNFNDCSIPEKAPYIQEEIDLISNKYNCGSIVWGKVIGWPWWPAMVDDDPDILQYYWFDHQDNYTPTHYHVTFFEPKTVSRAWLPNRFIKPYREKVPKSSIKHLTYYKSRLEVAKEQAEDALKLNLNDRLAKWSFVVRWPCKIVTPPSSDEESDDSEFNVTSSKYKDRTPSMRYLLEYIDKNFPDNSNSDSSDEESVFMSQKNEVNKKSLPGSNNLGSETSEPENVSTSKRNQITKNKMDQKEKLPKMPLTQKNKKQKSLPGSNNLGSEISENENVSTSKRNKISKNIMDQKKKSPKMSLIQNNKKQKSLAGSNNLGSGTSEDENVSEPPRNKISKNNMKQKEKSLKMSLTQKNKQRIIHTKNINSPKKLNVFESDNSKLESSINSENYEADTSKFSDELLSELNNNIKGVKNTTTLNSSQRSVSSSQKSNRSTGKRENSKPLTSSQKSMTDTEKRHHEINKPKIHNSQNLISIPKAIKKSLRLGSYTPIKQKPLGLGLKKLSKNRSQKMLDNSDTESISGNTLTVKKSLGIGLRKTKPKPSILGQSHSKIRPLDSSDSGSIKSNTEKPVAKKYKSDDSGKNEINLGGITIPRLETPLRDLIHDISSMFTDSDLFTNSIGQF